MICWFVSFFSPPFTSLYFVESKQNLEMRQYIVDARVYRHGGLMHDEAIDKLNQKIIQLIRVDKRKKSSLWWVSTAFHFRYLAISIRNYAQFHRFFINKLGVHFKYFLCIFFGYSILLYSTYSTQRWHVICNEIH